ncbi:MAG: hypothetical protein H3Z50_02270 [archaeon]|nr:hypothetical protein [archaeon]MCP8305508.1 hypothetical protein [archaeon]
MRISGFNSYINIKDPNLLKGYRGRGAKRMLRISDTAVYVRVRKQEEREIIENHIK